MTIKKHALVLKQILLLIFSLSIDSLYATSTNPILPRGKSLSLELFLTQTFGTDPKYLNINPSKEDIKRMEREISQFPYKKIFNEPPTHINLNRVRSFYFLLSQYEGYLVSCITGYNSCHNGRKKARKELFATHKIMKFPQSYILSHSGISKERTNVLRKNAFNDFLNRRTRGKSITKLKKVYHEVSDPAQKRIIELALNLVAIQSKNPIIRMNAERTIEKNRLFLPGTYRLMSELSLLQSYLGFNYLGHKIATINSKYISKVSHVYNLAQFQPKFIQRQILKNLVLMQEKSGLDLHIDRLAGQNKELREQYYFSVYKENLAINAIKNKKSVIALTTYMDLLKNKLNTEKKQKMVQRVLDLISDVYHQTGSTQLVYQNLINLGQNKLAGLSKKLEDYLYDFAEHQVLNSSTKNLLVQSKLDQSIKNIDLLIKTFSAISNNAELLVRLKDKISDYYYKQNKFQESLILLAELSQGTKGDQRLYYLKKEINILAKIASWDTGNPWENKTSVDDEKVRNDLTQKFYEAFQLTNNLDLSYVRNLAVLELSLGNQYKAYKMLYNLIKAEKNLNLQRQDLIKSIDYAKNENQWQQVHDYIHFSYQNNIELPGFDTRKIFQTSLETLASEAYEKQDYSTAIGFYSDLISGYEGANEYPEYLYYLGESYYHGEQLISAQDAFDDLIVYRPVGDFHSQALWRSAQINMGQMKIPEAKAKIGQFLELSKDRFLRSEAFIQVATLDKIQGDYKKSLDRFTSALNQDLTIEQKQQVYHELVYLHEKIYPMGEELTKFYKTLLSVDNLDWEDYQAAVDHLIAYLIKTEDEKEVKVVQGILENHKTLLKDNFYQKLQLVANGLKWKKKIRSYDEENPAFNLESLSQLDHLLKDIFNEYSGECDKHKEKDCTDIYLSEKELLTSVSSLMSIKNVPVDDQNLAPKSSLGLSDFKKQMRHKVAARVIFLDQKIFDPGLPMIKKPDIVKQYYWQNSADWNYEFGTSDAKAYIPWMSATEDRDEDKI